MDRENVQPRNRNRVEVWLWILIPLVIFVACERMAHHLLESSVLNQKWYKGALDTAVESDIDFIFVGSSRTMSGIEIQTWEDEIEAARGEDLTCFNFGRAFAGPVAHHFGLRELVERYPERMKECTVLFELSAGLPEYTWDWEHPWYFTGNAQIVVDYMQRDDLRRFLAMPNDLDANVGMLFRYLCRTSNLISGRRHVQQAIDYRGQRVLTRTLAGFGATHRNFGAGNSELPQNDRLRVDPQGVELLRDVIRSRVDPEILAAQEPWAPWERRVVCQTAEFLLEHGVEVAFHEVLVPSYVWTVNETEMRRADRDAFDEWATARRIPIIQSRLAVIDDDFPDLSHLRAGRISEYTRALAREFVRSTR